MILFIAILSWRKQLPLGNVALHLCAWCSKLKY